MTALLVIHDQGEDGGSRWAAALRSWPGPVAAPDLPGHGREPAPVGGAYELGDAVFAVAPLLPPSGDGQPVVLGVGRNGHAARILALAGRASALVLVDGLGGPWLDVVQRNAALRDLRRRILASPEALAPHERGTTDPRADMVLGPTDRGHVGNVCASIRVPTLVVETPRSPTPDSAALVELFPEAELIRTDATRPAAVGALVAAWWSDRTG